jgi:hypothetical protein
MYPTAKEIMSSERKFKPEAIKAAKAWKATHLRGWKDKDPEVKLAQLRDLVFTLADLYGKPLDDLCEGPVDCYARAAKTVYLKTPSIITALHELGHHLLGSDELEACRFSVWLFKKVFPKQFDKLHFEGHMLRRAPCA